MMKIGPGTIWNKLNKLSVRLYSSQERGWKEVSIKVPWGQIAGKWWGPYDKRPVLSIHGWQDNCATFDQLIPHLNEDIGFLAVDLQGHGHSSRLPPGMFYQFSNYVILIRYLMRQLQWPQVSLMGHSAGGIISFIYGMLYPENVDFMVCIDGLKPTVRKKSTEHMANMIGKFLRHNEITESGTEPPSYTLEELKQKVWQGNRNSIAYENIGIMLERNIAPSQLHPGKYYFTLDPRIKSGTGLVNFEQSNLVQSAQKLTMPIFISKSKGSSYFEPKERFYQVLEVVKRRSSDCDFHYVEGTHHAHLNSPAEMGQLIKPFIRRHNVGDRSFVGQILE